VVIHLMKISAMTCRVSQELTTCGKDVLLVSSLLRDPDGEVEILQTSHNNGRNGLLKRTPQQCNKSCSTDAVPSYATPHCETNYHNTDRTPAAVAAVAIRQPMSPLVSSVSVLLVPNVSDCIIARSCVPYLLQNRATCAS
jgi:hypothetical protein